MTTETEPNISIETANSEPITVGAAFEQYFRDEKELSPEDKPDAFPEIQRFVSWIGEDHLVNDVIASEVARFSETYRSNASETKQKLAQHVKGFLNYIKKQGYTEDSLASHIRVRPRAKSNQRATAARRRQTEVQITQQGYDGMQDELKRLRTETVRLAEEITRAAASGDVRENAPLEAARESQGMVQARIRRIESILGTAQIIDESERRASTEVQIGSFVTLVKKGEENGANATKEYQIVSANEADPLNQKISDISPVGKAVLGKKVDDVARVTTPNGRLEYIVERIF